MAVWFISRHPGAWQWAQEQGVVVDHQVAHLHPTDVQTGDTVIGTLPVNLVAQICRQGAAYVHLSLQIPAAWRGRELSADELRLCEARLEPYWVQTVERD